MQSKYTYIGLGGIAALAIGFLDWAIRMQLSTFGTIMLALGGILLLIYVATNIGYLSRALTGRSAVEGANMAIGIVIFLVIVIFLEILLVRHSAIFDLTRVKKFTLASQTVNLLKNLDSELEFFYISMPMVPDQEQTRDLMDLYTKHTNKIKIQIVDPEKNPEKVQDLTAVTPGAIYVRQGEKHEKVTPVNENNLTNAILKLVQGQDRVIYFTTGHNELSTQIVDQQQPGVGLMAQLLGEEGYQIQELKLYENAVVPENAEAVIIAGPKIAFYEPEIEALREYAARAGKLFFLIDPQTDSGLDDFLLEEFGVVLEKNLVIENSPISRMFGGGPASPMISQVGQHPIMQEMGGIPAAIVFRIAQGVHLAEDAPEDVDGHWLIRTSQDSWGETSQEELRTGQVALGPEDQPGPITLALALTKPAEVEVKDATRTLEEIAAGTDGTDIEDLEKIQETRVVVFGDSDFISNSMAGRTYDLFINCVNWLTHQEDLISIRSKEDFGQPIFVQATQANLIMITSLIILPLLVAIFGTVVCLQKRWRG